MKMKFMTALLTATSAIFASEQMPTTNELPLEVKHKLADVKMNSSWFSYMRVAVSDSNPELARVLPGLGLGFRFGLPVGAIDVSASYTGTDVAAKGNYFYTLPRVSYFFYASPKKSQSFYAGAGLAYGGLQSTIKTAAGTAESVAFNGLIPSLSVGYEMNRNQNWRSFFQVDVSQPAVQTGRTYPYMQLASDAKKLGPVAECSVGFGY